MANFEKIVIVVALDGDYKRNLFCKILDLVPTTESVIKINAVFCCCYEDNALFSGGDHVEIIGGFEKYMAVCQFCFRESTLHKYGCVDKSPFFFSSPGAVSRKGISESDIPARSVPVGRSEYDGLSSCSGRNP